MSQKTPACPDCGQHALRLLTGTLYHCERCRYTHGSPADAAPALG